MVQQLSTQDLGWLYNLLKKEILLGEWVPMVVNFSMSLNTPSPDLESPNSKGSNTDSHGRLRLDVHHFGHTKYPPIICYCTTSDFHFIVFHPDRSSSERASATGTDNPPTPASTHSPTYNNSPGTLNWNLPRFRKGRTHQR
jgi:hypothetical protein